MTVTIKRTAIPLEYKGETVAYLSDIIMNNMSMPHGTIVFKDWDAATKMIEELRKL
jgi:hypothetical protein